MYQNSLDVFNSASQALGGPSKKSIKQWITHINDKWMIDPHELIFKNALLMLLKDYKSIVSEVIEEGEQLKDYYKNDEQKKKLREYIKLNNKKISNIFEIELTNYQVASIDFLAKNRDKNIAILLPTWYWKTIISFYEILYYLENWQKVIFAAPTKTLVSQQYEDFLIFLNSVWKIELINYLEHQKTKKDLKNDTNIVFTTNHRAEKLCKDWFLSKNDLMVIDEVHIWEWKEWSNKKNLYPIYSSAEILNKQSTRIIWLTATTINKELLKEKLGIDEFYYAGKKEYFIPKNRHILALEEDDSFKEIKTMIDENIILFSAVLRRFLLDNDEFIKEEIEIFAENNILKSNFLDTTNNPILERLIEKIDKIEKGNKWEKSNFKRVFKIAKLIQLKKILITESYPSLMESLKKYQIESESTYVFYKKNMWGFFHIMYTLIKNKVNNLEKHPKEERMWEIIKENKKKNKATLVYVNNKTTVKWFVRQAKALGIRASYIKSSKNNSEKIINDYSLRWVKENKFDVVFMTSVVKLWINFDINEFIFYHRPDNEKDLLQLEWRVWRYSRDNNIYYLYIEFLTYLSKQENKIKKYINSIELPNVKIDKAKELLMEMFEQSEKIAVNWLVTSVYSKKWNSFDIQKSDDELSSVNIKFWQKQNTELIQKNEFIHARFVLTNPEILTSKKTSKPYLRLQAFDAYWASFDLFIFWFYLESELNNFIEKYELDNKNVYDLKGKFIKDAVVCIDLDEPNLWIVKLWEEEYDRDDYFWYKYREFDMFSWDLREDEDIILPDHSYWQEDMFLEWAKDTKQRKKRKKKLKTNEEKQIQEEMDI